MNISEAIEVLSELLINAIASGKTKYARALDYAIEHLEEEQEYEEIMEIREQMDVRRFKR